MPLDRRATLATIALALGLARASSAQHAGSMVTLTAVRAPTPPRIDGRDIDPVWRSAPAAGEFRTFAPREGLAPSFRTEARVLYDDRALYVLVRAHDPRPDSIVRRLARRDSDGPPNDQLQLFIDSHHDRRGGFEYIVNAAGVKSDYLLFDDSGFDQSWDGIWSVATTIDSLGWVAEYAIPLQQLRFGDRAAPTFGFMLWRLVGRTGERASLPAYRPSRAGLVSQFGTLGGLRDLAPGASLEALPYVVARARNVERLAASGRPASHEVAPSFGADLRWLPRPDLTVDATIRPDFGQVEADPAVLDLSGTEVFQAERRPFFLEGAGLLAFPLALDGSSTLFHSRRIGRPPTLAAHGGPDAPVETTIAGAAKVVARLAPRTALVGLGAMTQRELGAVRNALDGTRWVIEPRSSYGVARVQHDFRGGRSGVGAMVTLVDRALDDSLTRATLPSSARVVALTTQHQSPSGAHHVTGWLAQGEVRGDAAAIALVQRSTVRLLQRPDDGVAFDPSRTTLRGGAGALALGKVAGLTRWEASYRAIAPGFDANELGFLPAAGVQRLVVTAGLNRGEAGTVGALRYRSASATLGFDGEWGTNGLPFARGLSLTSSMQLPDQSRLGITVAQQLAGALCAATCTRGGPVLVDPPASRIAIDATGDPRRAVVPRLTAQAARDDEGRSATRGASVELTLRPRSDVEASLAAELSDARHDSHFLGHAGDASTDTARVAVARLDWRTRSLTARVSHALTRALSVQWYAQAYVSRGAYEDPRLLADPRARRYDDRFRPWEDSGRASAPAGIDFKQLRANVVLRWEYRPGSTLFVVWSQGRDVHGDEAARIGLWPGRDLGALFARRPSNVVAVKATYWMVR
ncbi:MAG TPA: DUF5916 domain-containing protein [Gemmatimonadaceae bacterium]|nr:DUF5916 domain-containing protein [Gemmatimonadaceae bacterium]